jgi:quinol monooxygenase YgiN
MDESRALHRANKGEASPRSHLPIVRTELSSAHMQVVHVHIKVKPECIEAFRTATLENARNSIQEPGIARFDVFQQMEDPTRFVLVEAYRNADAPSQHKETAHYQTWRDTVAGMMAEPRSSVKFTGLFPEGDNW